MKKKEAFYYKLWFFIPAMIGGLISACGFGIWMLFINNEIGSSVVANSISLVTMIVTGITLVFLYKTLKQQQEQIDKTNQDVEYNRIIDILYKQLEYSKKRLFETENLSEVIKEFVYNHRYIFCYVIEEDDLPEFMTLFNILGEDLMIYNDVLQKSNLDDENKKDLIHLIVNNLYPNLILSIQAFQGTFQNYQNDNVHSQYNQAIINNIEFNLSLILSFLYLPTMEEIQREQNEILDSME